MGARRPFCISEHAGLALRITVRCLPQRGQCSQEYQPFLSGIAHRNAQPATVKPPAYRQPVLSPCIQDGVLREYQPVRLNLNQNGTIGDITFENSEQQPAAATQPQT